MSDAPIWKSLFQKGTGETQGESQKDTLTRKSPSESREPSVPITFQPTNPPSGEAVSPSSELTKLPTSQGGGGSEPTLDELLLEQMDLAVVAFSEIMRDKTMIVNEKGELKPQYTFGEKMKAAEFVRDWVVRRRKLQPLSLDDDAPNITALRQAIQDEMMKTLERERVVRLPPKKNGRPTLEEAAKKKAALEAAAKAQYEAEQHDDVLQSTGDDDELKRALRGK